MIISVSRRTDIPRFYAEWFRRRLAAGFCRVRNPFGGAQRLVSLRDEDVTGFIFWTRDPSPLFPELKQLQEKKMPFRLLVTMTGYPAEIEVHPPRRTQVIQTLREIAGLAGRDSIALRYDPILLGRGLDLEFHRQTLTQILETTSLYASTLIVSRLDLYRKLQRRLREGAGCYSPLYPPGPEENLQLTTILCELAGRFDIALQSCCEPALSGIPPGGCVDGASLGIKVSGHDGKPLRPGCGCLPSVDIGAYDTCPAGCIYCYGCRSLEYARKLHLKHNPDAEML